MTTTVTESNQVSIPPDIARDFDIHPGTQLEWAKAEEGAILITPFPTRGERARQLMGAGQRWLKPGGDPSATWSGNAGRTISSTRPTNGNDPFAGIANAEIEESLAIIGKIKRSQ